MHVLLCIVLTIPNGVPALGGVTACSGRPIDANVWVSDTVVPRRVRAASARLLTRLPAAAAPCPSSLDGAVLPAFCDAICDSTPTVPGIALSASIV